MKKHKVKKLNKLRFRLPPEYYLVSNRNRVNIDRRKEEEKNKCDNISEEEKGE